MAWPSTYQWRHTYSLSEREFDVLYLMQDGLQNREIAYRLCISKDAVEDKLGLIVEKLPAHGLKRRFVRSKTACFAERGG